MFDKNIALSILKQIYDALGTIKSRTVMVHTVDDFTGSSAGMEKMIESLG